MTATISLRPIVAEDEPLLRRIYASTREEELRTTDWDDVQKAAFLAQQFNAQHAFYHQHFSQAAYDVILDGEEPVGRLYVDRREDEIRIIDIAVLTERRGRGIGTGLLDELCHEARSAGKPLRIHVEQYNPAMNLYQRLGFRQVGETGVHVLMEWDPDRRASETQSV